MRAESLPLARGGRRPGRGVHRGHAVHAVHALHGERANPLDLVRSVQRCAPDSYSL